jgi:micrococcal nuclease
LKILDGRPARFRIALALSVIGCLVLAKSAWTKNPQWVAVRWVVDGDTVILRDGRHVRYIGINSPEVAHNGLTGEPFGEAGRVYNRNLVKDESVRIEFDREKRDAYGRWLAYLYLRDGRMVNQLMIEKGLAYCLFRAPNQRHTRMLLSAQRRAMQANVGIWRNGHPKAPKSVIASRRSMRFHLPTCPHARQIRPSNRVKFSSTWDAYWQGFAPAKGCLGKTPNAPAKSR